MVGSLARLLSIASLALCAIVIASFAIFVVDETKTASGQQQQQASGGSGEAQTSSKAPGGVHRAIDEAASAITAPFANIVSASSGEWADRGAKLGLALAIYGFGLGFLSRLLRVHV
jgi:hypothetical protein